MADRVVKFSFRGDASDLERALTGVGRTMESTRKTANATGDVLKTAFGVALGISIDSIREKVFQLVGTYKEFFQRTQAGKRATAELKKSTLDFANTGLAPLNAAVAGATEGLARFLREMDPAAAAAFGESLSSAFLSAAKFSVRAITEIQKAFSGLTVTAEAGNVILERLKVTWALVTDGVGAAERQLQNVAAAEAKLDQRIAGHTGTVESLDEAYTDLTESIDASTRAAREGGGLTAPPAPPEPAAAGGAPAAAALAPVGPTLFDAIKAQVQETTTAVGAMYEDLAARAKASREQQEAEAEGLKSSTQALAQEVGAAVTQASQMVLDGVLMEYQKTKDEIADIEDQITKTTDKGAKDRLMRRKRAKEKELEEEKKAAMAAWVANKVAAIAQAAVSMALGIANSLSMGMPQGAVMAAISAVASGAAIAAIAAQPPPSFHAGGLVTGAALRQGNPDDIPASLRAGEFVSTPAAVSRLGRQTLEDAERGRLPSSGGEVVVRFNDRDLDVMHSSRLRAVGSPLQRATASSTRARYSSGRVRRG